MYLCVFVISVVAVVSACCVSIVCIGLFVAVGVYGGGWMGIGFRAVVGCGVCVRFIWYGSLVCYGWCVWYSRCWIMIGVCEVVCRLCIYHLCLFTW